MSEASWFSEGSLPPDTSEKLLSTVVTSPPPTEGAGTSLSNGLRRGDGVTLAPCCLSLRKASPQGVHTGQGGRSEELGG